MKVLIVAATLPYPLLTGSAVITSNHIKHLSTRHTVDLISFRNRSNSNLGDLPRWCNNIELVDRPPRWRVFFHMLVGIARDPDLQISRLRSRKMADVVSRRVARTRYDVVLFQTVQSAQFRPNWYQGPTLWSLEDPLSIKTQRMLPSLSWYLRPLQRGLSERLKSYDMKQAPLFDRVIFVNRDDANEYKRSVRGASTDWVPHGVDANVYKPSAEFSRRQGMIVITGNMYHAPNVDAVEFFCRDVFPQVCEREPSANLWLVGSRPLQRIKKLAAKNPRINVTGYVPDILPYLQQAMVSACPVRLRIGTQTKILEALGCATPVVTTSAGNYGIGASDGVHLYVADDSTEFANKVVDLLKGHKWHELSQNGRQFVEENFSWSKSGLRLEQILEELAGTCTTESVSSGDYGNHTPYRNGHQ